MERILTLRREALSKDRVLRGYVANCRAWARRVSNVVGDFDTARHRPDGSHQAGPRISGTPRFIRIFHSPRSIVRWWCQQRQTPLSVDVGPTRKSSSTWWIDRKRPRLKDSL